MNNFQDSLLSNPSSLLHLPDHAALNNTVTEFIKSKLPKTKVELLNRKLLNSKSHLTDL